MLLHQSDRIHELAQTLEGVVFALNRDDDRVCGSQRVDRQESERRRAVYNDVGILVAQRRRAHFSAAVSRENSETNSISAPTSDIDEGSDIEKLKAGRSDDVAHNLLADEDIVDGMLYGILVETDSARGVGLGIHIDEKCFLFGGGQTGGEIHRRGGLPYAPLLIGNRNYLVQWLPLSTKCNRV